MASDLRAGFDARRSFPPLFASRFFFDLLLRFMLPEYPTVTDTSNTSLLSE